MKVVGRQKIDVGMKDFPVARQPLLAWLNEMEHASWQNPNELKEQFGVASILKAGRVVFNICGNKYRLIVQISYEMGIVNVRFFGTHAEYDKVDAQII
ncbi:MAG: type II toxin-antitoxin system HigB family toxin [Ignavibacteria bacterium]|nr:type II toxin-antitoxin system HigB family toxin [Ignavibacteria bacterium]